MTMKWFWKVRIYSPNGQYAFAEIETNRDLKEIDAIQDAYKQLTNCKMLLEGISERSFKQENGFPIIWGQR